MSHQRRGYAASAAARGAEVHGVGWNERPGERLRENKHSASKPQYSSRYYENLSDPECSPEPSRTARQMEGDRDRRPFHFQFDGEDSDSGNDSVDGAHNVMSPMRSAYSEPVMLAPRSNHIRPQPPQPPLQQHHHHRSRPSQPRQPSNTSLDSTEREALLDRVRLLSSNEAETAAALARANAQNAALMEEVNHWRAVAKEAAASRRAAREALSDVSAENARLAAAYSAQRLEAEALHEALFHERSQAGARVEELEHALHVAEAKLDAIARKENRECEGKHKHVDKQPKAAPPSPAGRATTTATWDQERQDLLSLLERLQEQLATHAQQQQESAQQTPQKRPSSGHGRQATATAGATEQTASTPPRSSSRRSTPVVYNVNMEQQRTQSTPPQRRTPTPTAPPTAPGAPRTTPTPVRTTKYQNTPGNSATKKPEPATYSKEQHLYEENSKTPTPVEPLGVRCEASFETSSTATATAAEGREGPLPPRSAQATPVAQTPPLSATRPSSGDTRAATTPILVSDARPASPKQQNTADLKHMADKLFRQKRYDEALKQYSAALSAAETAAASEEDGEEDALSLVIGLLCSRATTLAAVGRYLESAADCCRADKLTAPFGGSCPRAIDLRAEAFSLMGAFDLASDDLAKLWQFATATNTNQHSNSSNNNTSASAAPALVARLQDAHRAATECNPRNHYAILGVKSSATVAEIKSAYRSLALRLHPDKAAEALGHDTATLLFSLLSSAHSTLGNTQSRRAYDLQLLRQKYVNSSGGGSGMGMGSSYRR
jgi:DnaJ-domain-containing protein 1